MIQFLIGRKIGMSQVFNQDGSLVDVTAIEAGPCVVTQVKTAAKEGYDAVQLGFGETKDLPSPEKGHLKGLSLEHLREFRTKGGAEVKVGDKVDVSVFKPGDQIDVIGTSRGRGFAGVVKRHHFKGGPKTHGQSDRQRAPGAIGSTTFPGRVLRGLRMAGHMGDARRTVQNMKVIEVRPGANLLLINGGVPGHPGSLLMIRRSIKATDKVKKG